MRKTIIGSTVKGWYLKLVIATFPDATINQTKIVFDLIVHKGNGGTSYNDDPNGSYYQVYTGESGRKHYDSYYFPGEGDYKIVNDGSFYVKHDPDGTKTITLKARWSSGNKTEFTPESLEATATFALEDIPRAATISVASDIYTGNAHEIAISRPSSKLTVSITAQVGSSSPKTVVTTTSHKVVHWTSDPGMLPNSREATVKFVATTFSGSKKIGISEARSTLHVKSSIKPSVTGMTLEAHNEKTNLASPDPVGGKPDIFIANFTKLRIRANVAPGEGAKIKMGRVVIDNPYRSYSVDSTGTAGLDFITVDAIKEDTSKVTIELIDTRDDRTTKTLALPGGVTAYEPPKLDSARVFRYSADNLAPDPSGTKLAAEASGRAFKFVTVGAQRYTNNLYLKYRDTKIGELTPNLIPGKITPTGGDYPVGEKHKAIITAVDSMGISVFKEFQIGYSELLGNIRKTSKGLAVALGKMSETDGLEVNMPAIFYQDVEIKNPKREVPISNSSGIIDSRIVITSFRNSSEIITATQDVSINVSVTFKLKNVKTSLPTFSSFTICKITPGLKPRKTHALSVHCTTRGYILSAAVQSTDGAIRLQLLNRSLTTAESITVFVSGSYFM